MARVMTDFRLMTPVDIPTVATLEREIYPQPWSERVFHDELALADRCYLVAIEGDDIIGYGGLLVVADEAHVTTVAVAPHARRGGLGSQLMLALISAAQERAANHITLEVRSSNAGARRLYEHFGFVGVGLRKNYYRDEDALVMWARDINGDTYQSKLAEIRGGLDV